MELEIPVEFTGDDSQTWLIGIDGPLSRVAQTEDVQSLEDGSVITLEIDPNGLLSDGMIVRGEVILASDSGHNYHIDVVLTAGSEEESTLRSGPACKINSNCTGTSVFVGCIRNKLTFQAGA